MIRLSPLPSQPTHTDTLQPAHPPYHALAARPRRPAGAARPHDLGPDAELGRVERFYQLLLRYWHGTDTQRTGDLHLRNQPYGRQLDTRRVLYLRCERRGPKVQQRDGIWPRPAVYYKVRACVRVCVCV
jgi:hypothetical protein